MSPWVASCKEFFTYYYYLLLSYLRILFNQCWSLKILTMVIPKVTFSWNPDVTDISSGRKTLFWIIDGVKCFGDASVVAGNHKYIVQGTVWVNSHICHIPQLSVLKKFFNNPVKIKILSRINGSKSFRTKITILPNCSLSWNCLFHTRTFSLSIFHFSNI